MTLLILKKSIFNKHFQISAFYFLFSEITSVFPKIKNGGVNHLFSLKKNQREFQKIGLSIPFSYDIEEKGCQPHLFAKNSKNALKILLL